MKKKNWGGGPPAVSTRLRPWPLDAAQPAASAQAHSSMGLDALTKPQWTCTHAQAHYSFKVYYINENWS